MGLEMKYFVLNPHGDSPNAIASRMAMVAYAESISSCDKELSQSLLSWVDREQAQPQQRESGNSSPTGQLTQGKTPAAPTPEGEICRCEKGKDWAIYATKFSDHSFKRCPECGKLLLS